MTDERDEQFDERLRDAAKEYNTPPAVPRAEMWRRIEAARRTPAVLPFRTPVWKRPFVVIPAAAALLALGIAIGRQSAPGLPVSSPTLAAPAGESSSADRDRSSVASQFATTEHLSQVETLLTEFEVSEGSPEFSGRAQDLLTTTRLMLDSKRVTDVRTRKLLSDLELVLTQIATIDPKDRREDLDFIADGLAQNYLRTRLRNAIPSGPAIRL
ncbi:MAG: hypothetical protein HOP28_06585 [Gemmatimonadales bacterium]|nr:hypothetical protein [Gemmatimonadales bacterium]